MKQHITEEQYHELTPEGKERLSDFIGKTVDTMFLDRKRGLFLTEKGWLTKDGAFLLSIGQMIDFLENNQGFRIEKWADEQWICGNIYNSEEYATEYKSPELCDALFEAVKEVLES